MRGKEIKKEAQCLLMSCKKGVDSKGPVNTALLVNHIMHATTAWHTQNPWSDSLHVSTCILTLRIRRFSVVDGTAPKGKAGTLANWSSVGEVGVVGVGVRCACMLCAARVHVIGLRAVIVSMDGDESSLISLFLR